MGVCSGFSIALGISVLAELALVIVKLVIQYYNNETPKHLMALPCSLVTQDDCFDMTYSVSQFT